MLSPELRSRIQELWDRFWSGGIANPLSAIEQISYLIFLKRLEDLDNDELRRGRRSTSRFEGHDECRWSFIKQQHPDEMLRLVRDQAFPFLKQLETNGNTFPQAMRDAVFIIPKPSLLASAVEIIDTLPISDQDYDTQGDLYEELLSELNLAGKNGQFRTSRHIIRTMVELADPSLGDWICDPAAGTAGFLVAAYQWMLFQNTSTNVRRVDDDGSLHDLKGDLVSRDKEHLISGDRFVGYDFDTTMVRLGLMNMMLHGIQHPEFRYQDTLSKSFRPKRNFDLVLANPPFTGNIDRQDINTDLLTLPTRKTELLFVELCLSMLEVGGRCVIIVPEGVLFGATKAHKELRRRLLDENQIEAVVSLPAGCFKPYTGVKTSILFFTKGGNTHDVWFYDVTGDGFTLDDRRSADPRNNDLQYVAQAYRILRRKDEEGWRSENAKATAALRTWITSRAQIEERDGNLTAAAYAPPSLEETVRHDPRLVLARVRELEDDIRDKLARIQDAMGVAEDA